MRYFSVEFKSPKFDNGILFRSKNLSTPRFWPFSSPTSQKFQTHKKFVVHFFIPMLLLPQTPTLIYLKLKKNKGPKMDSLFHFFHFFFTSSMINFSGVVLVPRYRRLTLVESYSYLAIDDQTTGKPRQGLG